MTIHRLALLLPVAGALALAGCHKAGSNQAATADAGANPAALNAAAASAPPTGGWTQLVSETPDGGFRMGNPDAPVKLVEYGSRTCPHCGAFAEEGEPTLKSKYVAGGKVSYEFRDFAIHAPDIAAILLGRCNGAQTFFPILEQMFAAQDQTLPKLEKLPDGFMASMQGKTVNQQAAAWADYMGYTQFVGQRGVPQAKAQACLADKAAVDAIGKHMDEAATKYNVNSTPTFIISGSVVQNAYDWQTLEPAIKSALGG